MYDCVVNTETNFFLFSRKICWLFSNDASSAFFQNSKRVFLKSDLVKKIAYFEEIFWNEGVSGLSPRKPPWICHFNTKFNGISTYKL